MTLRYLYGRRLMKQNYYCSFVWKLITLFRQSTRSLVVVECASLIYISFIDVHLDFVWIQSNWTDPFLRAPFRSFICSSMALPWCWIWLWQNGVRCAHDYRWKLKGKCDFLIDNWFPKVWPTLQFWGVLVSAYYTDLLVYPVWSTLLYLNCSDRDAVHLKRLNYFALTI